jgi:hypothetical protein
MTQRSGCLHADCSTLIVSPSELEAMIESCEGLIESAEEQLREVLTTLKLQQKDLDNTLLLVEAISIFANIGAALGNGSLRHAPTNKGRLRSPAARRPCIGYSDSCLVS